MTQQTRDLIKSLPNFAAVLEEADGRSTCDWEIVGWEGVEPSLVTPSNVQTATGFESGGQAVTNRFDSRTEALRFNADLIRGRYSKKERTERGHWGVWKITQGGSATYQTVLPVNWRESSSVISGTGQKSLAANGKCVELSHRAHKLLGFWAQEDGTTIQAVLERAVKEYDRQRFFDKADEAYKALRADPVAWQEEIEERAEWDAVLRDGIDTDEIWDESGNVSHVSRREPISA